MCVDICILCHLYTCVYVCVYVSQVRSNRESVPGQVSDWSQLLTVELCEALGQVTHRAREFIHMIDQCDSSCSTSIFENVNDDSNDSDPCTMMGMCTMHIIVTQPAN